MHVSGCATWELFHPIRLSQETMAAGLPAPSLSAFFPYQTPESGYRWNYRGPIRTISVHMVSWTHKGLMMKVYKSGKRGGQMPVKTETQTKGSLTLILGLLKVIPHLASRALFSEPTHTPWVLPPPHSPSLTFPFPLPSQHPTHQHQ